MNFKAGKIYVKYVNWNIMLSCLDVFTTYIGLSLGLIEGNYASKVMINLFGWLGIGLLHIVALIVLISLGWLLMKKAKDYNNPFGISLQTLRIMFTVVVVLRSLVVINNVYQILLIRGWLPWL